MAGRQLALCQLCAFVGLDVGPESRPGQRRGHGGDVVIEQVGVNDQRWGDQLLDPGRSHACIMPASGHLGGGP